MNEHAVVFDCGTDPLLGILHAPPECGDTGLVIIVAGGPQYRVGAHRQFVVLSRQLAKQGIPVLRFDHRGTGDSGGNYRGFMDMSDDIHAAIDTLCERFPDIKQIMLWGECESATAAAFYAQTDPRVSGIFMVNPWIRTEAGQAKTYLKHYYWNRLRDPKFWQKIRSGEFSLLRSVKDWFSLLSRARKDSADSAKALQENDMTALPLPERLTRSLQQFPGKIYILTSGFDYIAQEFNDFIASSPLWKKSGLDERITFSEMTDADHTFSRPEWRRQLFGETENWLIGEKVAQTRPEDIQDTARQGLQG
ncbi:MAG: hydrolase 1, exosortase A system-associated [Porticoccaceae bacterium]